MQQRVFWTARRPVPPVPFAGGLPERCDVAVVGGGLTGLSAAYHLSAAGLRVVLLEKGRVGSGASTRNAGMTLTGLKFSLNELIRRYGRRRALELYRVSLAAIDLIETLTARERIDCGFKRCGALCAAVSRRHLAAMESDRLCLEQSLNLSTFTLGRSDLARELASPLYCGAHVDPLSAGVDPAGLVAGLAALAVGKGAQLEENTPVTGVDRQNGGFRLRTPAGSLFAALLVMATNGYTPGLFPCLRRRIIPVGSHVIVTEPLPPELAAELIPRNRMVFDSKHLLFYFRRVGEDRLLFGGRVGFGEIDGRTAALRLQRGMHAVFPQLKEFGAQYHWSGNVGFTFDQMPHLGAHRGLWFAVGYGGHGVALSTYFGCLLADLITGRRKTHPFMELPFEQRFYYRRRPWFLPLAAAGYGLLDWAEAMRFRG
jgi:glycine/D-amino acid oxidase-like deaminating enzyme